jgi:hypothetical protein
MIRNSLYGVKYHLQRLARCSIGLTHILQEFKYNRQSAWHRLQGPKYRLPGYKSSLECPRCSLQDLKRRGQGPQSTFTAPLTVSTTSVPPSWLQGQLSSISSTAFKALRNHNSPVLLTLLILLTRLIRWTCCLCNNFKGRRYRLHGPKYNPQGFKYGHQGSQNIIRGFSKLLQGSKYRL